jgi:hypothetical protein
MDYLKKDPARKFTVGLKEPIDISDVGQIHLHENENVSFVMNGKEHDVTAKSWGYYATQSVNARLKNAGFKTALVKNEQDRYYIMVVDTDKMEAFQQYLDDEKNAIVEWLDEK